jgi:hypothetical protein
VAVTNRSEIMSACTHATRTSPLQNTIPKSSLWPARIVVFTARGDIAALQPEQFSYSCRASVGTGPMDHRSSMSVSRWPWRPEAGTRWGA